MRAQVQTERFLPFSRLVLVAVGRGGEIPGDVRLGGVPPGVRPGQVPEPEDPGGAELPRLRGKRGGFRADTPA